MLHGLTQQGLPCFEVYEQETSKKTNKAPEEGYVDVNLFLFVQKMILEDSPGHFFSEISDLSL